MEEVQDIRDSETASVVKVPREPAIIINGVPDLPPDCQSGSQSTVRDAPKSRVDPRFGEWLEGRKVKKLFGDQYYVGKVVKYESQSNWYSVVYDDGDQEDLEWDELEEILLPLDITIPLKTLVMDKCKRQSAVPDYKPKVGRPKKVYAMLGGTKNGTSAVVPLPQGTSAASNQTMVVAMNDQQSNNALALLQVPASNDTSASASAGENTQVYLKSSDQPRKRGRPRKDRSISGDIQPKGKSADIQPKKRGRPPKDSSTSGDSVHKRNAETARAERLKRENMRVQGATPGTQLF
uniref:Uncharacterized protein n=1 Tax=Avena sativa TaxID=4498 RepID=A0ACD5VSC1_AVESA